MDDGFNQERAAAQEEKLPWDLVEEILSRVPPISLVRFRTVCKRWNALFDDKRFTYNHKSTFRFILANNSKFYSVSIDPKIVVRELTLDISGLESHYIEYLLYCDEFLLCSTDDKGNVVWNPWLKQSRWIKADVSQPSLRISGIYYENNMRLEGKVYKAISFNYLNRDRSSFKTWKFFEFTNDAWKDLDLKPGDSIQGARTARLLNRTAVSLNGTLYWVVYCDKTDPLFHLVYFDFSKQRLSRLCSTFPCEMNDPRDDFVLMAFRGDRFSLLKESHLTRKIEIWVTKNKINVEDGDDVVWMNFMSIPDFPDLVQNGFYNQRSYYIDDEKRLVVCSCDETGKAWIYVVAESMLIRKVQIDSVVGRWPEHCTYFPSLAPVPRAQREEEAESQA